MLREGERWGEPMRVGLQRDLGIQLETEATTPKQQETAVLAPPSPPAPRPMPPGFVLSYPFSKAGTTRVPWGQNPGSRCEFGSSGEERELPPGLGTFSHSEVIP